MAQSTILAAAQTVATSSTVAVGPGGSVGLGLFVASGDIPANVSAIVQVTTPGAVVNIGSLNKQNPYMVVPGPCTVQVLRQEAGGASVGVYAESSVGQPVEGNIANNVAESGNPVLVGATYDVTPAVRTTGNRSRLQAGLYGSLRVQLMQADGNNPVGYDTTGVDGNSNTLTAQKVSAFSSVFNGATWDRVKKPNLTSRLVSCAATTNATGARGQACDLFKIFGLKATAAVAYLKLYNKASAPTVGTDIPVYTLPLQASSPFSFSFDSPHYFSAGLAYAITALPADADTTAVAAGDVLGLNFAFA